MLPYAKCIKQSKKLLGSEKRTNNIEEINYKHREN